MNIDHLHGRARKLLQQKNNSESINLEDAIELIEDLYTHHVEHGYTSQTAEHHPSLLELEKLNKQLRDHEEFLQKIFDSQSSYLTVINRSGTIIAVNEAWRNAAKYNQASDAVRQGIGLNYIEVCKNAAAAGDETAPRILRELERVFDGEQGDFSIEYDHHTPTGAWWFELYGVRFEKDNQPLMLLTHTNITYNKMLEIEIRNALQRERELNEMKTQFLSLVSHEFRTPMSVIQTSIDMLLRYYERMSTEQRTNHLDKMQLQLNRLTGMIDDVSLVNRLNNATRELKLVPVHLRSLLQQLSDEAMLVYQNPVKITLVENTQQEEFALDETLVRQIFANLISNGVKYSPANGEVKITWTVENGYLVLAVQDQGIGIPKDAQQDMYTPFKRGNNVGNIPGTGLGMVIVKHAVETYQGRVSFVSSPDSGTIFTVHLPVN